MLAEIETYKATISVKDGEKQDLENRLKAATKLGYLIHKKDTLFADTIYSNLGEKYICVMRNQVQGAVPAQGKN